MKDDWIKVEDGRISILRLRGTNGCMDIVMCYLDSESAPARQTAMKKLAARLNPTDKVLTVMIGDFNFVEEKQDRWDKENGKWTGDKDHQEAIYFHDTIGKPFKLVEWAQPQMTCETAKARSRIDRLYCIQHISHQLDRMCTIHALEWCPELSAHRPISFGRESAK